ncbi:VOC family protein [Haladaptatus sp. DFWS20]|uniref:VOC family protein n=1 Tax=Haladaptatus sp. DFWS20 TaxID=3403467 RepID=UPI003EB8CB04
MPTPNDESTDEESRPIDEQSRTTESKPPTESNPTDETNDPDIYPMPMFVTLEVTDVDGSTGWYREVAGFREVAPLPGVSHLRYRKYADVMLVPADESNNRGQGEQAASELGGSGMSLTFNVENETVDDVFERAQSHDTTVVSAPAETPWNTRQVTLADPDGYRLVFTEPVDIDLDFDTVRDGLDSG